MNSETVNPMFMNSVVLSAFVATALMVASGSPAGAQDRPDSVRAERSQFSVYPQAAIGIRETWLGMDGFGTSGYAVAVNHSRGGTTVSDAAQIEFALGLERRFHMSHTGAFSFGLRAGVVVPVGEPLPAGRPNAVAGAPPERVGHYLRLAIRKPVGARGRIR